MKKDNEGRTKSRPGRGDAARKTIVGGGKRADENQQQDPLRTEQVGGQHVPWKRGGETTETSGGGGNLSQGIGGQLTARENRMGVSNTKSSFSTSGKGLWRERVVRGMLACKKKRRVQQRKKEKE